MDSTLTQKTQHETSFYQDLTAVMENEAFQTFCTKYMRSWSDMETSCMYIKLYQTLSQYVDNPTEIIQVVDRIINTPTARRQMIDYFRTFQEGRVGKHKLVALLQKSK
jgi:hypothetical protein